MIKKIFTWLLIGAATICLTGCFETIVIKKEYVVVAPEDTWLRDCDIATPPDVQKYTQASWDKKEEMLTDDARQRIKDAKLCNVRLTEMREWKAKQLEIYKK